MAAVDLASLAPHLVVLASQTLPRRHKQGQQLRKHKLLALLHRRRARFAVAVVPEVLESAPEALLEVAEAFLATSLPPAEAAE